MPPGRTAGTEYVARQLTPEEEAALAAEAAAAEYGIGPAAATGDPAVVYAEEQAAPPPVAAEPQYAPVEPGMYEEPYVAPGQYAAQAPAPQEYVSVPPAGLGGTTLQGASVPAPDPQYDREIGSNDPYGAIGAVQTLPATTANGTDWAGMIAPPVEAASITTPSSGRVGWTPETFATSARRGESRPDRPLVSDYYTRTPNDYAPQPPPETDTVWESPEQFAISARRGQSSPNAPIPRRPDRAMAATVGAPPPATSTNPADILRPLVQGADGTVRDIATLLTDEGRAGALGLDVNDPETDYANQISRNLYDWAGDRAAEVPIFLGEQAKGVLDDAGTLAGMLTLGGRNLLAPIMGSPDRVKGDLEDIFGPHGQALRQAQSTFNPALPAIQQGIANVREGLRPLVETPLPTFGLPTPPDVEVPDETVDDIVQVMNTSLPTFGQEEPKSFWEQAFGFTPMDIGAEVGLAGNEFVRNLGEEPVVLPPGAPSAGPPDISLLSGDRSYDAIEAQRANRPPIEAPPVAYDPLSSAYLPREPGFLDRAGDAISGAVDAARNVELPDIALPDVSLTDLIPGRNAPAARATTGEPIVTRRQAFPEEARANDIRNLPAQYVPTEPGMLDKARGMIPSDIALPDVDLPGIDVAGTARGARDAIAGRISGGGDAPLPTPTPSSPALDAVFAEEAAAAAAALPEGVREVSGATESGVVLLQDANGVNVGIVQADGIPFVFPEEWTDDQKNTKYQEVKDALGAAAPATGNPAPGPATGAATVPPTSTSSTSTTTNTGGGDYTVTDYSDDYQPRSSGSSRSRSRSYEYDDEGDEDVGLSIEDFLRDHDGDGRISQRDRMVAKRLFAEAKKSRFGKGKGRKRGRSTVPQFPESPIRTNVLAALSEAFGR